MPKSGSFGICLVKRTLSITNIFFFEVPTPNGWHSAVRQTFTAKTNAVRCASATCPHQHFSHFHMPHSTFAYGCGCGLRQSGIDFKNVKNCDFLHNKKGKKLLEIETHLVAIIQSSLVKIISFENNNHF